MSNFNDANQVRLALKMKLCQYAWYSSSAVVITNDGYGVFIGVKQLDNKVRKLIAPVINGISVKVEIE